MKNYFQPQDLEETLKLLKRYGRRARILAGGTDLIPAFKRGEVDAEFIISINFVPGLDGLEYDVRHGLRIGARVTYSQLLSSTVIRERYPVLAEAAWQVGGVQVRNLATIAGNLCHAAPSADMAPPLMVMGARAEIIGLGDDRSLNLEQFFRGPSRSALKAKEMLAGLVVPALDGAWGTSYHKLGQRSAMEIALVGVAAAIKKVDGRCGEARIALGAVAPRPIRAKKAEESLAGKELTAELIAKAAKLAAASARPISDVRCSAQYRREMVTVLTRRVLASAWERAKSFN